MNPTSKENAEATPLPADCPQSHCSNNCEFFDVGDGDDYVDDVGDKNHW